MEFKLYSPKNDEEFLKEIKWNHEEIKAQVKQKLEVYTNLVYTEDQIKHAKTDRAKLNRFVDALESERKAIKKRCLVPYEEFANKVNEIVELIKEPIICIDTQLNEYEEKRKADKLKAIQEYFNAKEKPIEIDLENIFDKKWLNTSTAIKNVFAAIDQKLIQIEKDLNTLHILPEFSFEAVEVYKKTLDIEKAVYEASNMLEIQKAKEQQKQKKQIEKVEQYKQLDMKPIEDDERAARRNWIAFEALLTKEDAIALKEFFESRNIKYRAK